MEIRTRGKRTVVRGLTRICGNVSICELYQVYLSILRVVPLHIHTSTPNLMGVIWSELMISQAFQACYSIEGCLSNRCILSEERFTNSTSHQDHPLHTQENCIYNLKSFWDEGKGLGDFSYQSTLWEIYIRILQMLETQLKENRKGNPLFYYSLLCYESPKKELTSHVFEHLIYNLKSYNRIEI